MKLQFLGATGTVTGSKYLLQNQSGHTLIDCGLFQGFKQLRLRNWHSFPIQPSRIDRVILTHAHIDHTGYLPLLVRNGFHGPVYCTSATRDLCEILLLDSAKLQEEEAEFANRHSFSKHKPALPLYDRHDAQKALRQLKVVEMGRQVTLDADTAFHFEPSGHILGSAFVCLESEGTKVVFSGDLGRPHDLVMSPPAAIQHADYLLIESTYGNRSHATTDVLEQLAEIINRTHQRGGKVIIPTFAVGRTQSLLYCIHLLKQKKAIDTDLPVYLNSPMAQEATRIFQQHAGEYRLSEQQVEGMCRDVKVVSDIEESKWINTVKTPMILMAGSGMATGGRIVHHLKQFAPDPKNTILFTGFQAGGTRGAAMLDGVKEIKIHGEYYPVNAEIALVDNLSAHADAGEIIGWLRNFQKPPRRTFITHGEPVAADTLRMRIEEQLGWETYVPDYMETVELA
jgi:metallo-beta-lactamase family protein